MPALYTSPNTARSNTRHRAMRFLGLGTAWLSSPPTFTPSVLGGVVVNGQTVITDVEVIADVTYPNSTGVVTWTDSTTGQTTQQAVKVLPWARKFVARQSP